MRSGQSCQIVLMNAGYRTCQYFLESDPVAKMTMLKSSVDSARFHTTDSAAGNPDKTHTQPNSKKSYGFMNVLPKTKYLMA